MPLQDVASAPDRGPCHDMRRAGATRSAGPLALVLRPLANRLCGRSDVLESIRLMVPTALKQPVRQLVAAWDSARRSRALERATHALRRAVRAGGVSPALCHELRAAWGNPAWTADAEFLAAIASRALAGRGPVLECGSGLSTLVLGVIADECRRTVWSLEQDREWYRFMCGVLQRFAVRGVTLWHAPLVARGEFVWFDLGTHRLPPVFGDVVCDGPAVLPQEWPDPLHTGWRAGVVPELQRRGIRFGQIVLDDANDPRCPDLCRRWNSLGVATRVVPTATGAYVVGCPVQLEDRS